ncbi:MAG: bifunctional diaminohydroxyphosphoribosylaminopyrimidine deaminase/5-amino-6-(5-phosphoribosylamino)uracil reductase RibD [Campylobacterales bacterium]|nr:bifunctional diaminohydroxyphosphoribosylaminopyrimidine deaminase/5-amino-6-(5-phosphoribosylamino)uracil reductase RibD [Campylobacterales bacterium]
MRLAIEEAWKAQGSTLPNPAVGAVLVSSSGELLGLGAHQRAGGAHAELLALRNAGAKLSADPSWLTWYDPFELHRRLRHHPNLFTDTTLYVTLEPCAHEGRTPSCAALLADLMIPRVVIAHSDNHPQARGGAALLRQSGIEVIEGVCEDEAHRLLLPFLHVSQKPLRLFKWAQRLDGTIDGGVISSEASRRYVHSLRDACDLLVIGGNTVRTDRPTLDARLCGGRAPDLLIYSREKAFDLSIPLFGVPDRKVFIESDLKRLSDYRFVLIEGGAGMFAACKADFDLAFVAPSSGGGALSMNPQARYDLLHVGRCDKDAVLWMKRL